MKLSAILARAATILIGLTVLAASPVVFADDGDLPRRAQHPKDDLDGVSFDYGALTTSDGARLRTIYSRPEAASGKIPAIYFVQWLSCSTIELVDDDGWTELLSSLIRDSGFAVMRTEKAGVGDSEGPPCNNLGYDQEVQHHREALEALLERSDIDPDRVFLFGASMGANQAPLIANGHKLAGIMVWGGGAKTWFERMINFDRNALELGGTTATEITEKMKKRSLFHSEYLLRNHTPFEIETNNPGLKGVWSEMIGTAETNHYGRPFAFHWEAQNQNWALAWSQVNSPVVVMYGEYDWVEDSAGHQLIADIVNNSNPGSAQFRIIPKTNHHFSEFASKKDAFEEVNGTKNGANVAYLMMQWMNSKLR